MADALIAATARVHNKVVVTRNTADFVDTGVDLLDPWAVANDSTGIGFPPPAWPPPMPARRSRPLRCCEFLSGPAGKRKPGAERGNRQGQRGSEVCGDRKRCTMAGRRAAQPARRGAFHGQGQHRHRRIADHLGSPLYRDHRSAVDELPVARIGGGRRGVDRQDQHPGARFPGLHRQRAVRRRPAIRGTRRSHRRIIRGRRRRGGVRDRPDCARHRWRRVDPTPGFPYRGRRVEAEPRGAGFRAATGCPRSCWILRSSARSPAP